MKINRLTAAHEHGDKPASGDSEHKDGWIAKSKQGMQGIGFCLDELLHYS